ncbi:MAG: MFS transporter [Myxococcaceae bacterium]|nr:MFS transporter [Myxococcaceae bacterium]
MDSANSDSSRSIFEHRDFRLYQVARLFMTLGVQMQSVAVGLHVYSLTRSPLDLGYVGLAQFLPAIALSLVTGDTADRHDRRGVLLGCYSTMVAGALLLFGVATMVFGVSRSLVLSLAALVVLGATDMVSVVIRQTLVQLATPPEMRGRVSAVNMVFIGASNELGDFESGLTAEWFGVVPAVMIGGVGTCVVVALWAWLFPELRRIGSADEVKPLST